MAVRTIEEILEIVAQRVGDDNSDEALRFIEDISDTLRDYQAKADENYVVDKDEEIKEWERKYNELDTQWRERYKERFFKPSEIVDSDDYVDDINDVEEEEKITKTKYEDLFKED
jgi:hypothetical protein